MECIARLFNCQRCHRQTIICRYCDRGNIYCNTECSAAARQKGIKETKRRYEKTFRGKLKHKARQKTYRQRKKYSVTDQGSQADTTDALIQPNDESEAKTSDCVTHQVVYCHFCDRICHKTLRTDFLKRSVKPKRQKPLSLWPLAP